MNFIIIAGIILLIVGISYLIIQRIDSFIRQNKNPSYVKKKGYVRVGIELRHWRRDGSSVVKYCREVDPELSIAVSIGRVNGLIYKLQNEKMDLILLDEGSISKISGQLNYQSICGYSSNMYLVWKKNVHLRDRDKMIAILETRQGVLKSGYCDYRK